MRRLLMHDISIVLLAIGFVATTIGCGPSEDPEGNTSSGDTAVVHGELEAGGDAEGQLVTAYEVGAEGESTVVSREAAEVDSEGGFEVTIELELYTGEELYVASRQPEAEEGDSDGKVFVQGGVEAGAEVDTAPVNAETTFEVDTFIEARKSGDWNDDCNTADHRAMISLEAAVEAESSGDYQSEVEAYAKATTSAMQASAQYLIDEVGTTRADLEASFEARSEARGELDSQLLAGEQDSESGFEAYLEAAADARSETGASAEEQGREMQACAEAFLKASAELSAEVRSAAESRIDATRAYFVSAAAEAYLEALGAIESGSDALVDAKSTLQTELQAAGDAGARAAAWDNFGGAIDAQLDSQQSASLQSAREDDSFDAAFETYVDARSDIDATVDAETVAGGCVQAFVALWAATQAEASALAGTEGLIDGEGDAELIIALATHIELGSRA